MEHSKKMDHNKITLIKKNSLKKLQKIPQIQNYPPKYTKRLPKYASEEVLSSLGMLFVFFGIFFYYLRTFLYISGVKTVGPYFLFLSIKN
jgi:hypothetical protein